MPATARWKCDEDSDERLAGRRRPATTCCAPYTSARNASSDAHPLSDAPLDDLPVGGVDHPRHDVERERPLLTADVEGDALVEVGAGQGVGSGLQLPRRCRGQHRMDVDQCRAHAALGVEHLVPGRPLRVAVEEVRHGGNLNPRMFPGDCLADRASNVISLCYVARVAGTAPRGPR